MNKKQAIYWLSVALQIHYEPVIVEAFKIAISELNKQVYPEELTQISSIYC
jgi:hypothetical protein